MNIIYLHCHDAGRMIAPYGYPVQTPQLQKFADQSVLFRQAHCVAPTCSPSRASLLTGQSAHESGMLGLAHRGFSLSHPKRHLSHFLKDAHGYETYLSGIQHVFGFHDEAIGELYDRVLATGNPGSAMNDAQRDQLVGQAAADFLKDREGNTKPFILECGFFFPHRTFPETDADIGPDHLSVPSKIPDNAATREDMAGYHTAVRNMDAAFGRVWEALQSGGWLENSLIFFTTDHGIPFPLHKCQLYDSGTGIALMMRPPGKATTEKVEDALVCHLDIFPTICDYLNIDPPAWLQGYSLKPLIENKATDIRDEVFAEVTFHAAYEPKRSVRTKRYKFIRNYDLADHPALANIDDGSSKDWLVEQKLIPYPMVNEEFYDLWADPEERANRINDPSLKDTVDGLRARLDSWMQETNDPLLEKGTMPPPAGAIVTPRGEANPGITVTF